MESARLGAREGWRRGRGGLLSQSESGEGLGVHFRAGFAQVGNVAAALVHQADQPATGVEVLGVAVHVLGEMANAGGEARDLGLGGADIFVVRAQLGNRGERVLRGGGLRHDSGRGSGVGWGM